MHRLSWRILLHEPRCGAENMAIDHALAAAATPVTGVLRLYRWSEPTISFGRNEPARGRYDAEGARARGVAFVRRPTGGRAVLHDRELTYAVIVPLRDVRGLRALYVRINEALRSALAELGVAARIADGAEGARAERTSAPCFLAAAPGELVVAGRKLVGSAQVRVGGALLQHGSLLLDGDQGAVLELGGGSAGAPPATLAGLLSEAPPWEAVAKAVIRGFQRTLAAGERVSALRPRETELAEAYRERYASPEWTWRR
ncbi:MAG: lipoate--protein ligase family protein [Gemmatimonadetes bacterium]|nr:lipoate--protein ligase family protein [Gemmatimonadota bacterium]